MPHKTYNTPKRKCVVKTRLTEDERRAFEDKCAALSMSQSEYIRQAVFYSRISPVIRENGLIQAKQFKEAAGITGIVLTKLDGSAKGGIVIAIAQELQVPVKFIGVGEGIDDLMPFEAEKFVEALV